MPLSYKEVTEILKIIDASDLEEVVLELEGTKLVIRRGGAHGSTQPSMSTATPAIRTGPAAAPQSTPVAQGSPTSPILTEANVNEVRAPMVGSFYRRPAPDQAPFVESGSKVKAGDPLCLIEVMKLYTTLEAPHAGTVSFIGAEDTQLVEFDQVLFVIDPD